MKYNVNYLLIILVFLLFSCTVNKKHSKIISFSDTGVVVDYTESRDLREATKKADVYCGSIGKSVKYISHEENFNEFADGRLLAFFDCISRHSVFYEPVKERVW